MRFVGRSWEQFLDALATSLGRGKSRRQAKRRRQGTRRHSFEALEARACPATLSIAGTDSADTFALVFDSTTQFHVVKNNVSTSYSTSQYDVISIDALGGNDAVTVTGSSQQDKATLTPGVLSVEGVGYKVNVYSVETITVYASGATDTASFFDSSGSDTFTSMRGAATPYAQMQPTSNDDHSYVNTAFGFTEVNAYSTSTSNDTDTANLYDSPSDDTFSSYRGYGYAVAQPASGNAYHDFVSGFSHFYGYSTAGGADTAYLYDSPVNDTLYMLPNGANHYAQIAPTSSQGPQYLDQATGYANVYGQSMFGGSDTASMYDTSQNDVFTAAPSYSQMSHTGSYVNQAIGFSTVYGTSQFGGSDSATLYYTGPTSSVYDGIASTYEWLQGGGFLIEDIGFAQFTRSISTNAAPVLNTDGNPTLAAIQEDTTNPGTRIADLVYGDTVGGMPAITDAFFGSLLGIAVTGVNSAHGTWYYSTNNGANWNSLGTPSLSSARLLAADGNTRLRFTPNANWFGTISDAISFRAWDQTTGTGANGTTVNITASGSTTPYSSNTDTASLTVSAVADVPAVGSVTMQEDEWSPLNTSASPPQGLIINRNAVDGDEVTYYKITGITYGTLYQADRNALIHNGDYITAAQAAAGLEFLPAANYNGSATFFVQAALDEHGAGLSSAVAATINITPVDDNPVAIDVTATTNEDEPVDVQLRGDDGDPELNQQIYFDTIGGPSHGTLSGLDPDTGWVTYIPAPDYNGEDSFQFRVYQVENGLMSELGNGTVHINPVADTPSVTDSTTYEDALSDSGLVLERNGVDGSEVAYFKITNITGGTLYLHDGTTPVLNDQFITYADGQAGLRFLPTQDSNNPGTFDVQAAVCMTDVGLSSTATATISVIPVADTPSISDATTDEDTDTSNGLVIIPNSADGPNTDYFKILAVTNGQLWDANYNPLSPGSWLAPWQTAGLHFRPDSDYNGLAGVRIQAATGPYDYYLGGDPVWSTIYVNPVNDPPRPNNDSYHVYAGESVTGNVLTNDTSPDGDALSASTNSSASYGTFSLASDGSFVYSANEGASGADILSYDVLDTRSNLSASATATFTVTVRPPNQPPIANDDSYTLTADVSGNVLANDSDPDGNSIGILSVNGTGLASWSTQVNLAHGLLTIEVDGSFTFAADNSFTGTDSFSYTIGDGHGGTADATVTFTFSETTPVNQPPVAQDDSFTLDVGQNTYIGNVRTNDSDPDGDVTQVTYANGQQVIGALQITTQHGLVTVAQDGTIVYIVTDGANNTTDSFVYTIDDSHGGTATATVTLYIPERPDDPPPPPNNSPVPQDDAIFVVRGQTTGSGNLLTNDSDPDGDPLTVVDAGGVPTYGQSVLVYLSRGVATVEASGSVSFAAYTPFGDGDSETFSYSIGDGRGGYTSATVTISPAPNQAPSAANDRFRLPTGTTELTGDVLANDSDLENDPLVVNTGSFTTPHGQVQFSSDGSFTYHPDDTFTTSDTFGYTVQDDHGGSASATVTIVANGLPVAQDDSATVPRGQNSVEGNLRANDTDPDGDLLVIAQPGTYYTQFGSIMVLANGNFTYTLGGTMDGHDQFVYTLDDGYGGQATGTLLIYQVLNQDPTAGDLDARLSSGTPRTATGNVLSAASDPDGDPLSLTTVGTFTTPHGSVTIQASGAFIYTANSSFVATDAFGYGVVDSYGGTAGATVTVYINRAPAAEDDAFTVTAGQTLTDTFMGNDSDPDGDAIVFSNYVVSAQHGNVTIVGTQGQFSYHPQPGFIGDDTFQYEIRDSLGAVSTAWVTITVTAAPPVAVDDALTVMDYDVLDANLLANDSGTGIFVASAAGAGVLPVDVDLAHGHLSIDETGWVVYTPFPDQGGAMESFDYTIQNSAGQSATGQVAIAIGLHAGPQTTDDEVSTFSTREVCGNVLDNDTDPEDDALTVDPFDDDLSNGHLVLAADGTFTYTPTGVGNDSFVYMARDSHGNYASSTLLVHALEIPTVSVSSPTADEDGSSGKIDFTLSLSQAATQALRVFWSTLGDTAHPGRDYVVDAGWLDFAAGETSKQVSVDLIDDQFDSGGFLSSLVSTTYGGYFTKQFSLTASDLSDDSGVLDPAAEDVSGTGSICEDDVEVQIDGGVLSASQQDSELPVSASLSHAVKHDVTVALSPGGSVTIPAGQLYAYASVPLVADGYEGPPGDDDPRPGLTESQEWVLVSSSNESLSHPADPDRHMHVALASATGATIVDGGHDVTLTDGDGWTATRVHETWALYDWVLDGEFLEWEPIQYYGRSNTQNLMPLDGEHEAQAGIDVSSLQPGDTQAEVTITVSGASAEHPLTVTWATVDGTALSTGDMPDYTAKSGSHTFTSDTPFHDYVQINPDRQGLDDKGFYAQITGVSEGVGKGERAKVLLAAQPNISVTIGRGGDKIERPDNVGAIVVVNDDFSKQKHDANEIQVPDNTVGATINDDRFDPNYKNDLVPAYIRITGTPADSQLFISWPNSINVWLESGATLVDDTAPANGGHLLLRSTNTTAPTWPRSGVEYRSYCGGTARGILSREIQAWMPTRFVRSNRNCASTSRCSAVVFDARTRGGT